MSCEVEANPSVTQFYWSFNNTSESRHVDNIESSESKSVVQYKPTHNLHYGTLLCSAENKLGQQTKPCVYHIIPAGN